MDLECWFRVDPENFPCLEKNLALFQQRYPESAETVRSGFQRLKEYEFLLLENQQWACRVQVGDEFFCLYDPQNFQRRLQRSLENGLYQIRKGTDLLVIAGAGLNYLASHLEPDIRGDFAKGLLLVETRPELLLAQFCLWDCRILLESTQLLWVIGEPMIPILENLFLRERLYQLREPSLGMVPERNLTVDEKEQYRQIAPWFHSFQKQRFPELRSRIEAFHQRVKESPNLETGCIWAVSPPDAYAHTPLIRSLMGGFSEQGWKARLFEIQDGFSTRFRVAEDIIDSTPDVVLTCNTASKTFLAPGIARPCICWFLDHPYHYNPRSLETLFAPRDFVFYIDRTYAPCFANASVGAHRFLPAVSSFTREGRFREEFAVPILFVGSYDDVSAWVEPLSPKGKEAVFQLVDFLIRFPIRTAREVAVELRIAEEILEEIRKVAQAFTENLRRDFTDGERRMEYFLYALANSYKREQYVRALLDRGVVVYGPETWLSALGSQYASQYRGWLPMEHLADVYASAKVCLNIHSLQCPTCFNPRDFDVLAAGGCLLSDYIEDMDRGILDAGRDFVSFRSPEELRSVVDRLLGDKKLRESLRQQGRVTFLQRHTPAHRAAEMIRVIRQSYGVAADGL